ncbi:MAG: hypothetical protein V4613_02965 [Bacteroidota bacterium]
MKALDVNSTIIEGYLKLLDNLSPGSKLELISKLTLSVKSDIADRKNNFKQSFGAFDSKKTAEVIIDEIRDSRNFNRKIEVL